MNFLSNVYHSITSVCRKERPLNGKRAYPFSETIPKNKANSKAEKSISDISITRLEEEHNNIQMAIFAEEFPANPAEIQNEDLLLDLQFDTKPIQIKSDSMDAIIEANCEDKFEVSTEDLSSMGEKKLSSTSGESDEDDGDLEEKQPYKKVKLDSVPVLEAEEKAITEGWNGSFKTIRKYLGRMNRLFDLHQGIKERRDPLVISPEKVEVEVEAEPMVIEQEEEAIQVEQEQQQTIPIEQETVPIEQEENFDQENQQSFGNRNQDLIESFNPQQMNEISSKKKVVVGSSNNKLRKLSSSQDFTVAMPIFPATIEA